MPNDLDTSIGIVINSGIDLRFSVYFQQLEVPPSLTSYTVAVALSFESR